MKYKIYALSHDNEIRYIGVTTKKYLSQRLAQHINAARRSNRKNHRVNWIRSVDYDIDIHLICETNDLNLEIELIKSFRNNGFNLVNTSEGGECQWCMGMPDSVRRKIALSVENHPTRAESISKALKGRKLSEETKKKISKSLTGRKHPQSAIDKKSKPVVGTKDSKSYEFPSMTEAAKTTGASRGAISNCCKGKQKTAGGFTWHLKDIV